MTAAPDRAARRGAKAVLSFAQGPMIRNGSWIAGPFFLQQFLRLVTNIVLARLLAPEMFGLMLLVNTLRTGAELLSDIGISQSVVRSGRGEERRFLDTAWTMQVVRGVLLMALAAAAAVPIGLLYDQPELTWIILAVSPMFLFTGVQSPGLFLVQRKLQLKTRALYDTAGTVFKCAFTVALAAVMPSVWALVWGLVAGTLFTTCMSFMIGERIRPRFTWDRQHAWEIFGFGKWIFLSTAIYFAASSTDRLYFVAALPLALAGVYGVARTFADLLSGLARRTGTLFVFPKLAAMGGRREQALEGLRAKRFKVLAGAACAVALAIAGADQFILLAYDSRYHAAAFMLPVMLVGVWFGILAVFAEAMMMGCGKPAAGARANAAKFVVLLVFLPLAVSRAGMFEALLVLVAAEFVRCAWLTPALQRERLTTLRGDLALTAMMVTLALAAKLALGSIGLVPTIAEWWELGVLLHG